MVQLVFGGTNMITRDDSRVIYRRTSGKMNRQGRMLDRMYDERGVKGRKMTIAPGIVFIKAK
jgi:hypothetical protein